MGTITKVFTQGRFWCKRPCVNPIGNLYTGFKKEQAVTWGLLQKNRPCVTRGKGKQKSAR